jgi:superfamily II DNA or RNA helicase
MKIQLYSYQLEFIENLLVEFKVHKHIIGLAPCGYGKSYVMAEIARRSVAKGKRVLLCSHRLILLRQNNGALADFGHTIITINDQGDEMDLTHNMYCSTLQTIQSRLKRNGFAEFISKFDLIILDECHVQTGNFLFESGIIDDTYVLGVSGSPRRTGNMRQLGMDYEVIVPSVTVKELIALEKLVPCRYFEVPLDISGLQIDSLSGDFTPKSQYKKFDTPEVYGGLIHNYKKFGENRKFVCFCSGIAHCIKTCMEFNANGIPTKFVVSNLTRPNKPASEGYEYEMWLDRMEAYELLQANKHLSLAQTEVNRAFDAGDIQGVITIAVLSTGWDYRPLSMCILNRATNSLPLLIQMYGRVQRPDGGKVDALVLDLGTNVQRLGDAEVERAFSLWHETNDSVGVPAEKLCEGVDRNGKKGCLRLVLASMAICPFCGFRYTTPEELRVVELQERLKEEPNKWSEMSPQALCDFAELKNFAKTWVFRQLSLRGGADFRAGMRELGYTNAFIYRQQRMYKIKD